MDWNRLTVGAMSSGFLAAVFIALNHWIYQGLSKRMKGLELRWTRTYQSLKAIRLG